MFLLIVSTFCPAIVDGILVTVDESAAVVRVTLELVMGLLNRSGWAGTAE